MKDFFVTFGGGTPQRDTYRRIVAKGYAEARSIVWAEYENRWAFLYDAEEFKGQPERYGLTEIEPPLTAAVIKEHQK